MRKALQFLIVAAAWGGAAMAAERPAAKSTPAPRAATAPSPPEPAGRQPRSVDPGRVVSPAEAKVAALFAQRTVSSSQQFIIYCPESGARSRIASFVEEMKGEFLKLIGENDRWREHKDPIVILVQEPADAQQPAAAGLSVYQNEVGFKVQIDVRMGADPGEVNLQRYVARALMLEYAYREQPEKLQPGLAFEEPPWWLLEGFLQIVARRDTGLDTALFKKIVDVNRLPPFDRFLAGAPHDFDGTAVQSMDQACAMCLVQLLIEQPNGRTALAKLLQHWPESSDNPVGCLLGYFPGLGSNQDSLQKWWTLNLARFSAADRYRGLSLSETEAELAKILQFEVANDDGSGKTTFAIDDYLKVAKLKGAKEALGNVQSALAALDVRANSILAPIITEYTEIVGLIEKNKLHGLKPRLQKLEQTRADITQRIGAIGDYLNWFEATQMGGRSGKFDSYLKMSEELDRRPAATDPISKVMDESEKTLDEPKPARPGQR